MKNNLFFWCNTPLSKRIIRTMKITAFLLFLGIFSLQAKMSYSQDSKVTINEKKVRISDVINEIEKQTDYLFVYNDQIETAKLTSVKVKDVTVASVLADLFKDTNIAYTLEGKHIILSKRANINEISQTPTKKNITGVVLDENGEPLIGVSVVIKNTTTGTTTDLDGKYVISAGENDVLVFSYISYLPQEIKVGNNTTIDVTMSPDAKLLEAVVVTALGIKREEKTLTYNVQQLDTKYLTAVKDANIMNSISGKVAGVTISQSASGIGGSTRVVMRGTKSIQGNNEVLYVLDGMPMIGFKSKQSTNFYEGGDEGDFEGISMLNPDDIESMSVLTGAAAAALYGNKGANGVILINTKKGQAGRVKVNYSNSTSFANPFVMPQFQNTYGKTADASSYSSWGAKTETSSSYNPEDFFQTSYNTMNSIAVSGGSELSTFHASFGATNARGITPNNEYERYNFALRNYTTLVKDVLTMDAGLYYINQSDQNPAQANLYFNPIVPIYLFSPGENINRYRTYELYDSSRNFKTQYWPYDNQALDGLKQNPFWITERNLFENSRDRYMISLGFNYKINEWLSASVRGRIDRLEMTNERKLYASTHSQFSGKTGNYRNKRSTYKNMYADALLTADKQFGEDFRIIANIGGSFDDARSEYLALEGDLLGTANFFHFDNVEFGGSQFKKYPVKSHQRINSGYATAQLAFKNYLFLDLTGRYDYFSTMEGSNNRTGAFYPSVGLSGILSDMFSVNKEVLSFLKLRASYAMVGNPLPIYVTRPYYKPGGQPTPSQFAPATDVNEEKTKAFEVGTDIKLFQNKIDLRFTYYNTDTENQLLQYNTSPATGSYSRFINAGKVNNWGIELSLGYEQKLGPVNWYPALTYTFNRNKIKELPKEVPDGFDQGGMMTAPDHYVVSDVDGVYQMILKEGGTMSDIYVQTVQKDPNGFIFVHPGTGAVKVDPGMQHVGQAAPKYNLGFRNEFIWNNFTLDFLVDARVGGIVVSSTQALLDQYGVSKATADARDAGGVQINGGYVDAQKYYETIAGGKTGVALSEYTYSATNVRLRELSLAYKIPPKLFKNKLDITLSLTGRNLLMFYNSAPFDPELTGNTGTYYQGYDYFMQPSLRSLGFGVKVTL